MRERSSKKVNAYLRIESKSLNMIVAKVQELAALNQKLALYLEPEISNYCQVANRQGNRLILIAANGSIATQLRFQGIDLVRKFKKDPVLQKIQEIQCKVRPTDSSRFIKPATKKVPLLSAETAETVKAIADSLSDPKLKEIMQRIAAHTTGR